MFIRAPSVGRTGVAWRAARFVNPKPVPTRTSLTPPPLPFHQQQSYRTHKSNDRRRRRRRRFGRGRLPFDRSIRAAESHSVGGSRQHLFSVARGGGRCARAQPFGVVSASARDGLDTRVCLSVDPAALFSLFLSR